MDLSQNKLTKTEWNSIEVPVSEQEKAVLKLIDEGASNVNIRVNQHLSMIQYLNTQNIFQKQFFFHSC
jgi:ATP/maltotriose-dependent transcriptional regulator MalT